MWTAFPSSEYYDLIRLPLFREGLPSSDAFPISTCRGLRPREPHTSLTMTAPWCCLPHYTQRRQFRLRYLSGLSSLHAFALRPVDSFDYASLMSLPPCSQVYKFSLLVRLWEEACRLWNAPACLAHVKVQPASAIAPPPVG